MNSFHPDWYTTKDFLKLKPQAVFHKERENITISSPIKNYHCLARSNYYYSGGTAVIRLAADDCCKLYINGRYVFTTSASAYSNSYCYNELDITSFLNNGDNVIAAHLYYQGLVNRVWQSGDNRFGIGAMINDTNLEWRYTRCNAFSGRVIGYDTDFTENFDSHLWDCDWCKREYDDSSWIPMIKVNADYNFVRQSKLLVSYTVEPSLIEKREGYCFIDVGCEIVGTLRLVCCAESGDNIVIRYGEELSDDGSVRYQLRSGCIYEELWTLADGRNEYDGYCTKGFRYVEIITDNALEEINVIACHYPFDDAYCSPCFTDSRLDDIFNLCKNTIKYSTQSTYIDCPTREKGQYLGDAFISAHSHMLLTGDTSLAENAIEAFAQSKAACSGLLAVAPCSLMQEIADYSLLFGELLLMVYSFNNDKSFLEKYYPTAKGVILHFRNFERSDGLLDTVDDKWNMVDWSENMRDNYDFPLTRPVVAKGVHTVINAYYLGAMKTLAEIEKLLGVEPSFELESHKSAYINTFFNGSLFTDSESSSHCSLHSNALSLYYGLVPDEAVEGVADYIAERGFSCSVYFSYFVMKALAGVGRTEELFRLLVNDGSHSWLNMLREGATTCFEAWGKDEKWNTSLCHPWATAPISIILEDLKDYAISDND